MPHQHTRLIRRTIQIKRFLVLLERDNGTRYQQHVYAYTPADAAEQLGNRIRANNTTGITITGTHQPVPPDQPAGIIHVTVTHDPH